MRARAIFWSFPFSEPPRTLEDGHVNFKINSFLQNFHIKSGFTTWPIWNWTLLWPKRQFAELSEKCFWFFFLPSNYGSCFLFFLIHWLEAYILHEYKKKINSVVNLQIRRFLKNLTSMEMSHRSKSSGFKSSEFGIIMP